jgi:hypothetical protein
LREPLEQVGIPQPGIGPGKLRVQLGGSLAQLSCLGIPFGREAVIIPTSTYDIA